MVSRSSCGYAIGLESTAANQQASSVSKIEQYEDSRGGILQLRVGNVMHGERHMMPNAKVKILIVDDEPSIRMSLSQILIASGNSVRSAVDGFSALIEIRQEVPEILLSDLNMPGMSGFELLSVVRRRFPAIRVIAMSGVFSGDGIPPGVAADAFYEKGTGVGSLLQIVKIMTEMERAPSFQLSNMLAPIWIPRNGHDSSGEEYVMITCPECLRTFPQVFGNGIHTIYETGCVYCTSLIRYAIVHSTDPATPQTFQRKPGTGMPTSLGVPDFG